MARLAGWRRREASTPPYVTSPPMTVQDSPLDVDDQDHWREAILITVAATLIRIFLSILLPPYPDETYYWEWSRHLAFGYFDHPPAISFLIGTGTRLGAL